MPISITCDCGQTARVRYGDRWACDECGRAWNTAQIPQQDYAGLMHDLRVFKLVPIGIAIVLTATFVPLILFVSQGFIFLLPLLLGGLAIFLGPVWKRRVRRRIASAPRWDLRPE
jgi:hypothetical protein